MIVAKHSTSGCLVCGSEEGTLRRGLCVRHYAQFNRLWKRLSPEQQEAWEADLIKKEKLLPSKKSGTREEDEFLDDFVEFNDAWRAIEEQQLKEELQEKLERHTKPRKKGEK